MNNKNTITGIYNPSRNGDFGFVDIPGEEKGYYVFSLNKLDALPGDKVLAETNIFKGKTEAKIIKVLERSDTIFIGEFRGGKNKLSKTKSNKKDYPLAPSLVSRGERAREFSYGFVIVDNPAFNKDVFIPGKFIGNTKTGDIVGVSITGWSQKSPEGKIEQVLGHKGERGLEVDSFILEAGFKQGFSHEIMKELKNIDHTLTYSLPKRVDSKSGRVDLRNLFTFTIDGDDAKDLDDAISITQRKNGNFELYVHIADVSQYVTEGSKLDNEALKRSTSVYLTDRVIPMLPEKLSNDLCSLNAGTPKYTLTCEMLIGKDGKIKRQKVYESLINSDFRLTYKEVEQIISPSSKQEGARGGSLSFGGTITKELISSLKLSDELRSYIEKNRNNSGVLNFDFPETKIELDENKNPIGVKFYPKYKSNKIIEEFMISANEAVGREFSDYPFLHRIHPEPKEDGISKLQNTLNLFNIDFQIKNGTTKEFSDLLKTIEKSSKKYVLENVILRTLSKAIYSHENEGHFGLGLDYYSHFTSPIRRYPDLQIHRIIKDKIAGRLNKKRISHYETILENVANKTSTQERKAEKLEYKVRDFYMIKYYKPKVGEFFNATIVSMIPKGIFVQLEDSAEGFIDFSDSLSILYREDLMQFEDKSSSKNYILGDKIKVRLKEIDEKMLRLNFEINEIKS